MRYVIDSSVAFKWFVPETDSDKANRLRDDFRTAVHDPIAPDIYSVELAHALTRAERQGRLAIGKARLHWADALTTLSQFFSSIALTARAIDIASASRIGVYDCLYVVLAEQEGCEFITADSRLVTNLRPQFPFIVDLSTFP